MNDGEEAVIPNALFHWIYSSNNHAGQIQAQYNAFFVIVAYIASTEPSFVIGYPSLSVTSEVTGQPKLCREPVYCAANKQHGFDDPYDCSLKNIPLGFDFLIDNIKASKSDSSSP